MNNVGQYLTVISLFGPQHRITTELPNVDVSCPFTAGRSAMLLKYDDGTLLVVMVYDQGSCLIQAIRPVRLLAP